MIKQLKKVYRGLAWALSALFAAGMLSGCVGMYGPPKTKTSTPQPTSYNETVNQDFKG